METQTLILIFSAFFIASFLKGLTGIGFSTLCLAFLAVFIDMRLAIPLVFLPSLTSNMLVMLDAGRFFEAIRRFKILYLSALPGLLVGMWFLQNSSNVLSKALLGAVMLLYGIWGLTNKPFVLSPKKERRLMVPVGIVSGLVNGATGSQIMPIMPYLLSLKMDRNLFIQTINCAFTINTLIMMVGLGKLGLLNKSVALISAAGIVPVALGIYLGSRIRKKVSEGMYRRMVLVLLIVLGSNLFVRPFY